jgi:hypothetical protein
VRRIRELLYDQGFTISGARNRLADAPAAADAATPDAEPAAPATALRGNSPAKNALPSPADPVPSAAPVADSEARAIDLRRLRRELLSIRELLTV